MTRTDYTLLHIFVTQETGLGLDLFGFDHNNRAGSWKIAKSSIGSEYFLPALGFGIGIIPFARIC
jgi:hypothetical protein